MNSFDNIQEDLAELNPEALFADGFEDALIGYVTRFGGFQCREGEEATAEALALYDYDKCIEVLIERDGMTYEDAIDYMEFNVVGAWVGNGTPCFLHRPLV